MYAGPARTAIAGVGHSRVYRRSEVSLGALAIDAVTIAAEDAGLTVADIDGLVGDSFQPFDGGGSVDGIDTVTPTFLINAMHLDLSWWEDASGSSGRAIIEAINAVASGVCRVAVAFRALHNPVGRYGVASPREVHGPAQYFSPFGVYAPGMFAPLWTRYMYEYGTTRDQMAPFIVNNRRNALLWEHGYWYQHRPEPLSIEGYLHGRMISEPLCIYDCDIPIQGVGAFLISSADFARELRHKPAYVRGWQWPGDPIPGGGNYMTELDIMREQTENFAKHLYANSGVTVADIDIVNVYDGFSIFVPIWMEALGFCKPGEGFDFLDPERIALEGSFPVNTSSGNLGAGRMHGVAQFMDSVLQLQGRAGPRQVRKNVDVALATGGGRPGEAGGVILSTTPD